MVETAPPTEARIARKHREAALLARRAGEPVAPAPELEHCDRCRRETDHYYVYWYTRVRVFPSTVIRDILIRVFVIWCAEHKGAPPLTYTDKPFPTGAWQQKNQRSDGGKPDYEDAIT